MKKGEEGDEVEVREGMVEGEGTRKGEGMREDQGER